MTKERLTVEATFQDQRTGRPELRAAFYAGGFARVKQALWQTLAAASVERVLELGCGPGDNLETAVQHLRASVRVAVALDLSWESLKQASVRPHVRGLVILYVRGDAERLPVASESLDLVYGLGILHHLRRPAVYQELHRVLRPGGLAVCLEPLAGNWFVDLFRRLTPRMRSPFETPLRWGEWGNTGSGLRVRHREFLLTSVGAAGLGLVLWDGRLKRTIDAACWPWTSDSSGRGRVSDAGVGSRSLNSGE